MGLYRIVQELLANATKHSGAAEVHITLASYPDRIKLVYRDDGIGMDVKGIEDSFSSMGVYGMKERVRSMDGKIDFHSLPNKGLTISISLPSLLGGGHTTLTQGGFDHD
nr:ATP-binding protein [Domibacillus tundrae]